MNQMIKIRNLKEFLISANEAQTDILTYTRKRKINIKLLFYIQNLNVLIKCSHFDNAALLHNFLTIYLNFIKPRITKY